MKMPNRIIVTMLVALASVHHAVAQGTAFQYEGRLSDGSNPVNGAYDLRFTIYDSTNNPGTIIAGPITNAGVGVANGLFAVTLDFGPGVFSGAGCWLEIGVRTNVGVGFATLSPRQPVLPTPSAMYAAGASAAGISGTIPTGSLGGSYGNVVNFNNAGNQFAGSGSALTALNASQLASGAVPALALGNAWKITGNSSTTAGVNFLGTTDNKPLELKVNGQRAFRLEPRTTSPNVIGGFSGNYADTNAVGVTIAGGGTSGATNCVLYYDYAPSSDYSCIGGGRGNSVQRGTDETIGGGQGNAIGAGGRWSGDYSSTASTIGGGSSNVIDGVPFATVAGGRCNSLISFNGGTCQFSTISGGESNTINGSEHAAIGGGNSNWIDYHCFFATIAGGQANSITAAFGGATIGGGLGNRANATGSTIAGGGNNFIHGGETQPALYSTIAGGWSNYVGTSCSAATISGGWGNGIFHGGNLTSFGVVGGGQSNFVYGVYGVVPGGFNNLATNYAFAAGYRAKATNEGAFVWASGNTNDYPSQADNRVHFYAENGLKVENGGQAANGSGLRWIVLASTVSGRMINVHNGAYLSEGGSWTDSSDRNAKENFQPVNAKEILEQVSALPIASWNYRSENKSVRHVGPVAQDFSAAFGLGADDKHIAPLDSSGVALAAIQGLNDAVKQKDAEIKELRQSVAELKSLVNTLLEQSNGGGQ